MTNGTKILVGVPSKEYGIGRQCAWPGCRVTLSRYNPDKVCSAHTPKPRAEVYEAKEQLKVCTRCAEAKPATAEYFHHRYRVLASICKTCVNSQHKERRRLKKERTPEGYKRCPRCGKDKPRTAQYWRTAKSSHDGFSPYCDDCILTAWREATRKSRAKKAQTVVYETPQGMMKGTVEE